MTEGPLTRLRIVELGESVSSAYCARLLTDWGARAIKIERPGRGDPARWAGPFLNDIPHPETSGLFLLLNANKRGITLDVTTPTGRDILLKLLKDADVFVESNPPRLMSEWGLTYERLRTLNPHLIMISITPFGQSGPYRDYKLYHLNLHHAGGEGYLLPGGLDWERYRHLPPVQAGGQAALFDAGVAGATSVIVALIDREFTGKGQHADISQQDVEVSVNRAEINRWVNQGFLENRSTRSHPGGGGLFECADGYILILAGRDHMWEALLKLMGEPQHLLQFNTAAARREHRDEINQEIARWARTRKKEEIYHQGQGVGISMGIICDAKDLLEREQYQERGYWAPLEHPMTGKLPYPFVPYQLTETPAQLRQPAPLLGQHTEEVFTQELGYSGEDLVALRRARII